jgi:phosphoribosylanthranilate isomerase
MLLKASSITNLTDARYFAAREVNYLGFNLEAGSDRFLDPIYMKAIREWVEGPVIVGEFHLSPLETIREAASFYGLDAVEVPAEQASNLDVLEGLKVLLYLSAGPEPTDLEYLKQAVGNCELLILDFGSCEWAEIEPFQAQWKSALPDLPVLLQFNFKPDVIEAASQFLPNVGLGFVGEEEEKVGVKSFDDLEALFEQLEEED